MNKQLLPYAYFSILISAQRDSFLLVRLEHTTKCQSHDKKEKTTHRIVFSCLVCRCLFLVCCSFEARLRRNRKALQKTRSLSRRLH